MGAYGSPDTGNLYHDEKQVTRKKKKGRPQTNIWVWVLLIIFNVSFVTTLGLNPSSIFTAISLDILVIDIISIINLFYNLIKKNRDKLKDDIIWVLSGIIIFFIVVMTYGSI